MEDSQPPAMPEAPVDDVEWLLAVSMFADHRLAARFITEGFKPDDLKGFSANRLVEACLKAAARKDESSPEDRQIHYQVAVTELIRAGNDETNTYAIMSPALSDSSTRVGSPSFTYARCAASLKVSLKSEQLRRNLELVNDLVPQYRHLPVPPYDDWLGQLQGRLVKTARMFSELIMQAKDKLWKEVVGDVKKELRTALDQNLREIPGRLTWGLLDADKAMMQMRDGELIVIGARPSIGKSALIVHIARVNARKKKEPRRFLLFSYEDSPEQVAMRMNQQDTGISASILFDSPKSEQERFMANLDVIEHLHVEVINASGMSIEQVCAKAELIHSIEPVDGVGLDYIQLVTPTDRRVPREQQVAEVSRGAKLLAGRIQRPVIVLSQLNRGSEHDNRPPRLSDLRESGAIEQDADRVVLLHRPAKNSRGEDQDVQTGNAPSVLELWLIQAKMRNGPTTTVRAAFVSAITKYENLQP